MSTVAVMGGHERAAGLLARLMEAVRPEFRAEVFHPPRDSAVFIRGTCRLPNCPTVVGASRRLCSVHYQRWLRESRRPGCMAFEAWLAATNELLPAEGVMAPCVMSGCNRASAGYGLCRVHSLRWTRQGRPNLTEWLTTARYVPDEFAERDCAYPSCSRWVEGRSVQFCRRHDQMWKDRGRPDLGDWFAEVAHGNDPRVKLAELPRLLRLQVQFGLQCRHDEGVWRTPPEDVTRAVRWIRTAGVTSLLDWDEPAWRALFAPTPKGRETRARKFILDTRLRLQALLIAADPWADQYPRDTWDLRLLGVTDSRARFVPFGGIGQPWLRELAKRWCRWRLGRGLTARAVRDGANAVTSFAEHLAGHAGLDAGVHDLTRARIESWLAVIYATTTPAKQRSIISTLSVFLRDVHRNGWAPGIASNAYVFDDSPRPPLSRPRWINEALMRQLESEHSLALFPSEHGRLVLRILIACGLRLKDARQLPFDCVVRDHSGAPYLAWINYKMRSRPAFFPISEALAEQIATQQRLVLQRFPAGCKWLFPGLLANLDGSKPMSDKSWRNQLAHWLVARIRLVDEHGRPTRVTAHQFRHTLGTRLINANVPQHIVQQLLDHMSPAMTAVYARLHNRTLREHWEKAVKINADGQTATVPAEHPLADAAWTRLSMVRAKVSLPNGYCGAPVQTDCEYANPCLDCRFFITTADFLDQHRRQRDETATLITDAEHAGLARVAEKNRRTLGKLETIITALETTGPNQIVAGGTVEDLDAAS